MHLINSVLKIIAAVFIIALNLAATSCNNSTGENKMVPVNNDSDALYKKYNLDKIKLPAGFTISVYAEVPNARSMALSPSGTLFVGTRDGGKVYAVKDNKVYTIASDLHEPNGVAFKDGNLYIATISLFYE